MTAGRFVLACGLVLALFALTLAPTAGASAAAFVLGAIIAGQGLVLIADERRR